MLYSHLELQDIEQQLEQIELWLLGDLEQAYQASLELLPLSSQLPPALEIRITMIYGKTLWAYGRFQQSIRYFNRAIKLSKLTEEFFYLPELYLRRGIAYFSLKRYLKAVEDFVISLDLSVEVMSFDEIIESYLYLGALYALYEKYEEANELLKLGFYLAKVVDSQRLIAKGSIFIAGVLIDKKEYQLALDIIYEAESCILAYGDMTWVVEAGKIAAVCYQGLNRMEEAELYFCAMLALSRQQKLNWACAILSVFYAEYLANKGLGAVARELLECAEPDLSRYKDYYCLIKLNEIKIKLSGAVGDFKGALKLSKDLSDLKMQLIDGDVFFVEKNNKFRLKKFNRLMAGVKEKRDDILNYLGGYPKCGYKNKDIGECIASRSRSEKILVFKVDAPVVQNVYVERKVKALFQEACVHDEIWFQLAGNEFVLFPSIKSDALSAMANQLKSCIDCFPWSWHRCTAPTVSFSILEINDLVARLEVVV